MKLQLWLGYYVTLFLTTIAVVLGLDQLYLIFKTTPTFSLLNLCLFFFRTVTMHIVMNELVKAVHTYFIIGLMVVSSMNDFIREIGESQNSLNEKVKLYRKLQIWCGYVNQNVCYFAVPPLICFGVAFVVLTLYGTIRLAGKMSWVLYPIVPISNVMSFFFVVGLVPCASIVFES